MGIFLLPLRMIIGSKALRCEKRSEMYRFITVAVPVDHWPERETPRLAAPIRQGEASLGAVAVAARVC